MIPDVQKVINHSGNVSADIFNTRLIKPPTSVLVFPLKVRGGGCGRQQPWEEGMRTGGRSPAGRLFPPAALHRPGSYPLMHPCTNGTT